MNQLPGFNSEELRIIEKKKLLGVYAKEIKMQSLWETLPFQYECSANTWRKEISFWFSVV